MSDADSLGGFTPEPEPMSPVDLDGITTTSLEALQSDGQRKILDIVDDLRRHGLSGIVGLPQLVVCGDQSSGKSSVLEAITEIPFPRNENLCTRFATEIIMRRHVRSSISIRINPDKSRADGEQEELRKFDKTITDFTQLGDVIAAATAAMGLEEIGQKGKKGKKGQYQATKAFAKDVLTVEISGPTRPQLTLVDLPGLIHSANRMQTEDDVKLIQDLVLDYMKNSRTIIMAVITAKNDYANQIVLKHCQAIDPQGKRTLGIITKPDSLTEGTANQKAWLELAQNRDIYFQLGWHMVKNRSELEGDKSFVQRNQSERQFFSRGAYAELPNDCKGIETLRSRLSSLLHDHLKNELPLLKAELVEKLQATSKDLGQLGVKRSTTVEQRLFLTDIGQNINSLLQSAIQGQYYSSFFETVNMKAAVDHVDNIRRFRAVIQHLNLSFSDRMHRVGHKYAIPSSKGNAIGSYNDDDDVLPADIPAPIKMSRDEAIDWVHRTLERSRGCELPGSFNPLIISQLFWDQSKKWNELILQHIDKVFESCKTFVRVVLEEAAPSDIRQRLSDLCIDAALEKSLKDAKEELEKVMEDKGRHPMTYNHFFTSKIQDQRKSKYAKVLSNIAKKAQVAFHANDDNDPAAAEVYIDPAKLDSELASGIEQDMDKFSAEDALDSQLAYYADELKFTINVITKQVIERHLVNTLGSKVLSPRIIAGMTDEQIALLTAEAPEVTRGRERLEERRKVLDMGLKVFKEALGGFV